jgi:hypothetical protein
VRPISPCGLEAHERSAHAWMLCQQEHGDGQTSWVDPPHFSAWIQVRMHRGHLELEINECATCLISLFTYVCFLVKLLQKRLVVLVARVWRELQQGLQLSVMCKLTRYGTWAIKTLPVRALPPVVEGEDERAAGERLNTSICSSKAIERARSSRAVWPTEPLLGPA